jgi:pSer/pThr/pTyr-binding forkhead associated (FHA) protein
MARLILSLDSQVLAEYNMSKERYTIGRLPDNDVRIDNPAVSGHHSLIINILNDSFLEDLNSTNGTYVNGKLIKKHALQHGDVITIGHHQLRFSDQQATETEQDEFEKTMVIPAGQQSAEQLAKAEKAAAAAASRNAAAEAAAERQDVKVDIPKPEPRHAETAAGVDPALAPNALPLAKLQVLSGAFAGRELELTKTLTTLGRPGVQVAAITRRAEGYFIVHVESGKEGDYPLVNGQPIGAQARKLADNDVLQLAGVKMGFFTG